MVGFFKKNSLDNNFQDKRKETPCDILNATMEKLRAKLFTLTEAVLPEVQANSFKKAVKDYTSEAWNILTKLLSENQESKEEKDGQ